MAISAGLYDQAVAKWLGAPLGGGTTTATRAKDSDRAEACKILDAALADGELSSEEHRQRVSAATNAVTLGDLQALVEDLQGDSTTLQPAESGAKHRPLGLLIAAFVVSVLLGVGIGWGIYGNTGSPLDFTTDPGAKPDGIAPVVPTPPTQLHSLGGLTGLLEQTRKRFGDVIGYRLPSTPHTRRSTAQTPPTTAGCWPTITAAAGVTRPARPRAPPTARSPST